VRRALIFGLISLAACDSLGTRGPEWEQVKSLAVIDPLVAPPDRSNRHADDPAAIELGHRLYFDPGFSGKSTLIDMLGRSVTVPPGRAAKGEPINVACVTCHDPARGGADVTSQAQVSIGAGAYDVTSQPTLNSAFHDLWYWNGRNDSLWSQILAVTESPVSVGGNRLHVMWRLLDGYRTELTALHGPVPTELGVADQRALLLPSGECRSIGGNCPAECHEILADTSSAACVPRFPFEGRPGATVGCQYKSSTEPFGDAWDCMEAADKDAANGVYVTYSKVIAAYETTLLSQDSPFDRWVKGIELDDVDNDAISESAKRGARLFAGKASCVECHSGVLLTDEAFHDVGVPQDGDFIPTEAACIAGLARCDCVEGRSCLPWGLYDGLKKLQANGFRRDSKWSDDPTDDSRKRWYELDLASDGGLAQKRRWKTPSLRDVSLTGPYMHSGRYRTLREVLDHYNGGGETTIGRDPKAVPLGLDDEELDDIVSFLETLNGAPLPLEHVTAPDDIPSPTAF
jgi:cytochrome c peroxidase